MNDPNDETRPRQVKDAPFCWQHKEGLTMLTEIFGESDQQASARSLYVALSELASDKGSETFTVKKALIAHKAGLSVSTVQRLLKGLEEVGLVKIDRNVAAGAFKAPNTYTLLTIGHGDSSIGIGRQQRLNPDKVKERERTKKRKQKETQSAVFSANGLTEDQKQIVLRYNETFVPKGWLPVDKITPAVRNILEDCTRQRFEEIVASPDNWPSKHTFAALFWHAKKLSKSCSDCRSAF